MSVWMIVYMMGQIGGSIGPVPYGMDECERRAAERNAQVQAQVTTGLDVDGNPLTEEAKTLRFECVAAPSRPKNTYNPA